MWVQEFTTDLKVMTDILNGTDTDANMEDLKEITLDSLFKDMG